MKKAISILAASLLVLLQVSCSAPAQGNSAVTPAQTSPDVSAETASPSPTVSPEPTATAAPEETATAEPTDSPEPTASPEASPTATASAEPTATPDPNATATATPDPNATATAAPTPPPSTSVPAGMVKNSGQVISSNTAMYQGPDSNSQLICKLKKGTYVQIIKTNVNAQWHQVKYDGQTGYINRVYICLDSSLDGYKLNFVGTIINCKNNVNVRSGPSTLSKIIGVAKKDTKLTIMPQETYIQGWYMVKYEGQTAYISADFLGIDAVVGNDQLSSLTIKGGKFYPSFSPNEYGYVIKATSASVTITARANSGVVVDINKTGKSKLTVKVPASGMRTVRISLDGKIKYSLYISRSLLTVGTWNIKRGDGNLLMQGRLVYDQQPDIMGIQEVYQKLNQKDIIDNLQSLKTSVMSNCVLSPTINYPNGGKYGDGIISRYALSNVQTFALDSGGFEKRLLQRATVVIGGKTVSMYNTHFSYNSAAIRKKQFAKVLEVMDKDPNPYKILTGDFNAGYAEFALFGKNYTVVNQADVKYYDYNRNEISYYALDNVIVSKNIKVVNSRIIVNSFSDHYMVMSYLILN